MTFDPTVGGAIALQTIPSECNHEEVQSTKISVRQYLSQWEGLLHCTASECNHEEVQSTKISVREYLSSAWERYSHIVCFFGNRKYRDL